MHIKIFISKTILCGDLMNKDEIFSLSLDIGQGIIKCGGEVNRAEDTIKRINLAHNQKCSVFAIPSLIIAQCGKNIQIRKIEREDTNLAELDRLNDLSRRLCGKNNKKLKTAQNKVYSKSLETTAVFAATSAFCLFFKGSITDAVFSGIIGIIISYCSYKKISLPLFSANLIDAFIAGTLSYIPKFIGLNVHPDKIIVGTIMLLVPGLTIVNAMRDMMNGDLIAGMLELFNSVMSALAIAFGVAGAIMIFNKI